MKLNLKSFTIFFGLLLVETLIAIYFEGGFIRHVFGDFLAVIMLIYFFKSFLDFKNNSIAITVLLISYSIEFLQLIHILEILNLQHHKFLRIVFGTTFSATDLIAYSLGICIILLIEKLISSKLSNQIFQSI